MTFPNQPTPMSMPGAQQAAAVAAQQTPPAAPQSPAPQTPESPQPPAGTPAQQTPPPAATAAPAPPWGSDEEFDPQKAWNLIQNLRGDKDQLSQQLAAAQPILTEHERQRQASLSEQDRLNEQLTTANNTITQWRTAAVRSKAEALAAAARFQDPGDAIAMIGDLSRFIDGDNINEAGLNERIAALAAEKPYLVATQGAPPSTPQGFTPNPAQGQSGAGQGSALDAQIKAAQARGDFTTSIALQQQKLLNQS